MCAGLQGVEVVDYFFEEVWGLVWVSGGGGFAWESWGEGEVEDEPSMWSREGGSSGGLSFVMLNVEMVRSLVVGEIGP